MNRKYLKRATVRLCSLLLAILMLSTDAEAVVKGVFVWGAKSINDRGYSDTRITMEDLEQDFSGYMQTDGLTEYFHKDQAPSPKENMTEALAWLIDNGIICRDSVITVTDVGGFPGVSITKEDVTSKLYTDVKRSDALMYIYKAVFGPLFGRVIGIESPCIRVENGTEISLFDLMESHGYLEEMKTTGDSIEQETKAATGAGGIEIITPDMHYDEGGSSSAATGNAINKIIDYIDTSKWRYTPQGDKVVSIFGDTNLFISDVEISQEINTGIDTEGGEITVSGGSPSLVQSGDHGSGGTATGNGQAAIDYDTDYKEIFYVPGADLWFYRTTDVVEMYLQTLQSKGIIEFEASLRSDEYNQVFTPLVQDGAPRASWSSESDPYLVNLSFGQHRRADNVAYAPVDKVLGKSFKCNFNGSALTLNRNPIFESETGYFTTEYLTRMDVYRYLYAMVSANEKKLTQLESDIVSYKYGLQYGEGLPGNDLEVIKFLVAKGILNYDGSDELSGLYTSMTWEDLIPILYRVANPNARLDFSQVQLTDSEKAWKAQGFQPSSLDIKPSGSMSEVTFDYSDEYLDMMTSDLDVDDAGLGEATSLSLYSPYQKQRPSFLESLGTGINGILGAIGETFSAFGKGKEASLELGAPDVSWGESKHSKQEDPFESVPFVMSVAADEISAGTLNYTTNSGMLCLNGHLYFDFAGMKHLESDANALKSFKYQLKQMDTERRFVYAKLADRYDSANPKHTLLVEYLENVHFIAGMLSGKVATDSYIEALKEWRDNPDDTNPQIKQSTDINPEKGWDKSWQKAREDFADYAVKLLEDAKNKKSLSEVSYTYFSGGEVVSDLSGCTAKSILTAMSNRVGSASTTNVAMVPTIKFTYVYKDGTTKSDTLELPLASFDVDSLTDDTALDTLNKCPAVYKQAVSASAVSNKTEAELAAEMASQVAAVARTAGITFETEHHDGGDNGYFSDATLALYADPTDLSQGYVKWSEIVAASGGEIIRQSECLLINTKTNTQAYFSFNEDPSKTRAIVGPMVINGDSKYGVIKKVQEENGVEEVYYHINAVRQLMGLSDEKECIGGRSCIAKSDETVIENAKSYPVTNSTGTQSSAVTALKAVVHTNAGEGNALHSNNPYYQAGQTLGNLHYCNFIALSQSNRVANAIYRKFTYTPQGESADSKGGRGVAYGVVIFRPADVDEVGTPAVNSSTSLQDLLDAPGQAPAGDQTKWNQNMKLCNDYANWIYGTSNVSYVNTGYLRPEVYLFIIGDAAKKAPPTAIYGSLTEAERLAITSGSMGMVAYGHTAPRDSSPASGKDTFEPSNTSICQYYMDTGYRAMLSGERLFLNEKMFDNIQFQMGTNGKPACYNLMNSSQVIAPFSVGNTFHFFESADGRSYGNPTARVKAISKEGTVTCQIGPFYGLPVKYSSYNTVVDPSYASSTSTFGDTQFETTRNGGDFIEGADLWKRFYFDVSARGLNKDWVDGAQGKVCEPALFSSEKSGSTTRLVYNGTKIQVYEEDKRVNVEKALSMARQAQSFKDYHDSICDSFRSNSSLKNPSVVTSKVSKTEVYFEVTFSAWHYSLRNGVLVYSTNVGMSAFLNPALFTNLNDALVDKMMDESNGAIPVNEIPNGSLLKVGDYYYQAVGMSTDQKSFVGYAPLFEAVENPTEVHAAKAFTSQMIYAGNQYINVAHWIDPLTMLKPGDQANALSDVAKKTLVGDGRKKYAVYKTGEPLVIETGVAPVGDLASNFTPVQLTFQDGLLAYKGPTVEQIQGIEQTGTVSPATESQVDPTENIETQAGGTDTYLLCNHAEQAVTGPLDDVPFLVDDVLDVALYAVTVDIVSAGFKHNDAAPGIRDALRREFQKAFAGDLITLIRMLVFIVLMWLVVAAWMCYFMWLGNLIPLLEAIRYPSGDRGKKGIDLMKVVSLGTISLDTEFRLGRFLQYTGILAVLLCIVMLTGR